MKNTDPYPEKQIINFVEALGKLPDHRDNRGKRHILAFIVVSVVLALLVGRSTTSGIFRYIRNKIEWLRTVTGIPDAKSISRAHLPRLLEGLDWDELNALIEAHFGVRLERAENQEWVAIDGKVMRGTVKSGNKQATVLAVAHESRTLLAQAKQSGSKSSEIPVVRKLLKDSGLEKGKVTLDAHHCNPKTTAQIHQAGGYYLTQVKENQSILLEQCKKSTAEGLRIGSDINTEKGHGRITVRRAELYSTGGLKLHGRWADSGIKTLVVMERETFDIKTQKTSRETSYYISNQAAEGTDSSKELSRAVRKHWGVESDNWIRDVTLKEDKIRIKSGNQAQIMSTLRSLSMRLLRKSGIKNFQEAIEGWADCTDTFEAMLKRLRFL